MADLVWVYNDKSLPHIHGRRNHINNTILLTAQSERAKAAKTWATSTNMYMQNQFASTHNASPGMMNFIKTVTNPEILESVEASIQENFERDSNEKLSSVKGLQNLDNALAGLKYSVSKEGRQDQQNFIKAFDELLTVIDNNVPSITLWGALVSNPANGVVLNPNQVMAIVELQKLMSKYLPLLQQNGTSIQALAKKIGTALFNNISSVVSENFYTGIQQIANQAEIEITDVFKSVKNVSVDNAQPGDVVKTGAEGNKVSSTDRITSGKREKSADSIVTKHTQVYVDGYGTYTFDVTIPASMKYYVNSKDKWIYLSQYSGKNSILMDSLHEIYGANWDAETAYAIYNALVFSWSSEYKNDSANKNFRIIKHDLILRTAYTYLAGSQKTMEGRIFFYNGRAYPVLGILKAIYDKELNLANIFDPSRSNRYFDIYISHGGNANKWVPAQGDEGKTRSNYRPDRGAATVRIERAMQACDKLLTRGIVRTTALDLSTIAQYLPLAPSVKVDLT